MMLIYSVIYMVLASYVERVNPGAFGISQPWNYPFKKSYWRPRSSSHVRPVNNDVDRTYANAQNLDNTNNWIELNTVMAGRPPSISVSHMNKVGAYVFHMNSAISKILV